MIGESRVTVTGHGTAQTTVQVSPQPSFPVETASEMTPSANGNQTPATPLPQQFNLQLHNLANIGDGMDADARLNVKLDRSAAFQLQPGRYRLGGTQNGTWYIRSATCGVTDLLSENLVVAAGSAGSPIRLILSNANGQLKGAVTTNGQPAGGWVYLVPEQPSLVPSYEVFVQPDGSYFWSGPPGRYLAVPTSQELHENFRDPAFLHGLATAGHEVEVTTGSVVTANLTLAPAGVAR